MKRELAFQLLQSVLPDPPWNEDALRRALDDLRVLAEHKYNKYEMYQPARLFFENLYLFLSRFRPEHRTTALEFVRNDLIYISRDEFQQLSHVLYHDRIRQVQLDVASSKSGIPRHHLTKLIACPEFTRIQRASLYVALSDGARIDYFRRQNLNISNEQVLTMYYPGDKKIQDLSRDLRDALEDANAQFECLFLLDDFCGSGRTLLREVVLVDLPASVEKVEVPRALKGRLDFDEDFHQLQWNYRGAISQEENAELRKLAISQEMERGITELIAKCIDRTTQVKGSLKRIRDEDLLKLVSPDATVRLAPLLATEYAITRLQPLMVRLAPPLNRLRIEPAAIVPNTVRVLADGGDMAELCETYYDPGLEDKHTSDVKYGYDECGLPLILHHNTPNNSLYFLWARKWGDPLFARFERHGREVRP